MTLAVVFFPDESSLKSDQSVPDSYQSVQADKLANQFSEKDKGAKTVIAVYTNGNQPLTDVQNQAIDQTVKKLRDNAAEYKITGVTDAGDSSEAKSQVVSKDKTTRLVQLTVKSNDITKMKKELTAATATKQVRSYITGSDILDQDFGDATGKGIAKTELIAVIFIFVVLIFVFKSPITPILSLATVGVSAVVGISIVYNMVKYWGLSYSDLTEAFIIIVLFGIGTDYNILLYNEFRSGLVRGLDKFAASKEAIRVGGRIILYAGVSVLIGMGTLYFADFYLYKSAFGIAISVAVLLMVLLTLNPFFMTTIYLKSNTTLDNQDGLRVIDQVTQNLKSIKSVEKVMSVTQPVGEKIKALYVKQQLSDVTSGLGSATNGLSQIKSGLHSAKTEIDGSDMSGTVKSATELSDGSKEVAAGAASLQSGIGQITTGINQLQSQLTAGTADGEQITQLAAALPELNQAINQLNEQVNLTNNQQDADVTDHLTKIGSAANEIGNQLGSVNEALQNVSEDSDFDAQSLLDEMKQAGIEMTAEQQAAVKQSIDDKLAKQQAEMAAVQKQVTASLTAIGEQAQQIGDADQALASQLTSLNETTSQLQTAVAQLTQASNQLLPTSASVIQQLSGGMDQLKSGTTQLTTALNEVDSQTGQLTAGAQQVANGNSQFAAGFTGLAGQMKTLSEGLASADGGLGEVSAGTNDVNKYVKELKQSSSSEMFYVPNDMIHGEDFKSSLDTYLSDNRKMTSITVYLKGDPSTVHATKQIDNIKAVLTATLAGTDLKDATFAIGGTTSSTKDLNDLATKDFVKTAAIMLMGILIALLFVTRSFWQSIAIEGTLVLAYYAALNIVHWVTSSLLGQDSLTWNTPFFSFIMLIALGVDYTIFLMLKYRDELAAHKDARVGVKASLIKSVAMIGTVVISAAVILGGTFATLIPSGVLTLIQVALVVIVGLVLLVILIPLVLPAVISLTQGNTAE
ncbi:MMPL family transporter [Weissella confusa]|uniref:MMPL family transporter n=1 Tax=Weissella confusa TaxID=1583 RepID=UPI0021AFEDEC|nr:MMPL family transporter [Weissella confusa]